MLMHYLALLCAKTLAIIVVLTRCLGHHGEHTHPTTQAHHHHFFLNLKKQLKRYSLQF